MHIASIFFYFNDISFCCKYAKKKVPEQFHSTNIYIWINTFCYFFCSTLICSHHQNNLYHDSSFLFSLVLHGRKQPVKYNKRCNLYVRCILLQGNCWCTWCTFVELFTYNIKYKRGSVCKNKSFFSHRIHFKSSDALELPTIWSVCLLYALWFVICFAEARVALGLFIIYLLLSVLWFFNHANEFLSFLLILDGYFDYLIRNRKR